MLYQLSYFRKKYHPSEFARPSRTSCAPDFATPTGFIKWEVMDSNHRRRTPADLQSAPFGHSGNFPYVARGLHQPQAFHGVFLPCRPKDPDSREPLPGSSLTPPLRCSHRLLRADGGIRTHDQLITNQLLWPTELHRQFPPFWIAKVGIKNLSAKYFRINFSLFHASQRTSHRSVADRCETGCKDRKSFEYHNSFGKKYRTRAVAGSVRSPGCISPGPRRGGIP